MELGIDESFEMALLKAFEGSHMKLPHKGSTVIMTVRDEDKAEAIELAKGFTDMGIKLMATAGTAKAMEEAGIPCTTLTKVSGQSPNILDVIASGEVDLVIDTPTKGHGNNTDGFKIRRGAVEHNLSCVTAIDTARAVYTVVSHTDHSDLIPVDITTI